MSNRRAEVARKTKETDILLELDLDGTGQGVIETGIGFLDHMLEGFARHGSADLKVRCDGDRHVDDHHSAEDVGICLGMAIDQALGDRAGIRRYGHAILPMDEALVLCAIDLGGRPYFSWEARIPTATVGTFDTELVPEFWRSVATLGRMNLHVKVLSGSNSHHIIEAIFKGLARALRDAWEPDPRCGGVPSTKGTL